MYGESDDDVGLRCDGNADFSQFFYCKASAAVCVMRDMRGDSRGGGVYVGEGR